MIPKCRLLSLALLALPLSAQQPPQSVMHPPGPVPFNAPLFAAESDLVVAAWTDEREHPAAVYFNRSIDAGRTWQATDTRVSVTPAPPSTSVEGVLLSGSTILVFTIDQSAAGTGLFCSRSLDAGHTWQSPGPLIAVEPGLGRPRLVLDNGVTHVTWRSILGSGYSRSLDHGATWSPPIFLTDDGRTADGRPEIAADAGVVCVGHIVTSLRNRRVITFCSVDDGATWAPPRRVDGGPTGVTSFVPSDLRLAVDDGHVHALWNDNRQTRRLYIATSHDSGATWPTTPMEVDDGLQLAGLSSVLMQASRGVIHVAWVRRWSTVTQQFAEGRYRSSQDHGVTWMPTDVQIEDTPLLPDLTTLAMASDGPLVTIGWNVDPIAFVNRSVDAGANWLPLEVPLPGGGARIFFGSLVAAKDKCHAQLGAGHVLLFGTQPYGDGNPGSGGFTPRLEVTGAPLIGQPIHLRCEGALGSTPMVLVGGSTGAAQVSIGPLTLLVDSPSYFEFALTSGRFLRPGVGTLERTWTVPADPTLVGTSLNLQAFVFDLGAAGLLSHTAGRELWLL